MEEMHIDTLVATQPRATTLSLVQVLPLSLLAHSASNLDVTSLLRLQRCSSALYHLRTDDAYMMAAWRWAELCVSTDRRLPCWTVPREQCIESGDETVIPVSVWQAALPVWRAAVARRGTDEAKMEEEKSLEEYDEDEDDDQELDEEDEYYDEYEEDEKGEEERQQAEGRKQTVKNLKQAAELVQQEQPTMWILVERDADGSWKAASDDSKEQSADVQRVEVLRDVDWRQVHEMVPWRRDEEVRCGWILRACPYLQHLKLAISFFVCDPPSHADTFALVPRLRSLRLTICERERMQLLWNQNQSDDGKADPLCNYQAMLDSLPCLISLTCAATHHFSAVPLLAIASHSTLEELHIDSRGKRLSKDEWKEEEEWIGLGITFPVNVRDDTHLMMENDFAYGQFRKDHEAAIDTAALEAVLVDSQSRPTRHVTGSAEKQSERDARRIAVRRMHAALTRTQPTQRSCQVRLALADWLHRRLLRGKLFREDDQEDPRYPKSLLFRYRMLMLLLRSTLQRQLTELQTRME